MILLAALLTWTAPAVAATALREASLRGAQSPQVAAPEGAGEARRRLAYPPTDDPEYVGCFGDTETRVMSDMFVDTKMTPAMCRSHCDGKGNSYYATQYGTECFCGQSDNQEDYEVNGAGVCEMPCSGDDSVPCGDFWMFTLYKYGGEEPSTPFSGGMYGTTYSGDATYYGYTTAGNCAFKDDVPGMYDGMIPTALNAPQYGDSLMCGACVEGTASGVGQGADPPPSSFKAFITDQCPECDTGDLDFSMSGDGRWDIEWEFVACPGETISFVFEGSNAHYWKIQPRGTRTPVESLEINGEPAYRTNDNFFVREGGPWEGPQEVTTTTVAGVTQTTMVSRS